MGGTGCIFSSRGGGHTPWPGGIVSRLTAIFAVMFIAVADHGAAASDSGPRWMHIEVGAGYAAGSIVTGDNVGALSATLGLSHPLARELRSSFEVGYFRLGAQGPG